MRVSVPSLAADTQIRPPASARPLGPSPAGRLSTRPVVGSILETVASRPFATHTDPAAARSATGPAPTVKCPWTTPDVGFSLRTALSVWSATHNEPNPKVSADGRDPTGNGLPMWSVAESM